MRMCHALSIVAIVLLLANGARAQEAVELRIVPPPDGQPCQVDPELSLWLAQESVDRALAALERERRDLAGELASLLKSLDLLSRADRQDGVPLAEMNALLRAQAVGRDVLSDTTIEIENRLSEIERTLKVRRKQQATLETRLEAFAEAPVEDR